MSAPSERVLAPLAVLGLHLLLLSNVALHRPDLLTPTKRTVLEWLLALGAILAYVRTVCCDPGFLASKPRAPRCASAAAPLLCLWPWRNRALGSEVRRPTYMDTELQPIGWQLEEEVEDPGEEIISLEELSKDSNLSPSDAAPPTAPPPPSQLAQFQSKSRAKLRFCKVCQMHQPLRTKHCRDCGRCVRTHDHHCPWVGTCVGEGNRVYFFWFLVLQWCELLVFTVESCAFFAHDGLAPPSWLRRAPLLLLGTLVKCMLLVMVTCLVCFHSYLALANITTWESISWYNISYLKSLSPEDGSPFSQSIRMNLAIYCCSDCCKVFQTEDGWLLWELGEQHNSLECQCCGSCAFDVE
ncbi:unnamed protein product [Cladocopium goreaui]|uniref:Palmitoyltransferase n=1 Tax=Cladocopium goreaui TaxID=2562237 RepID=A0A9P1G0U9_9DINO|nr:unnamed protein product [Cladocopium goreaui]